MNNKQPTIALPDNIHTHSACRRSSEQTALGESAVITMTENPDTNPSSTLEQASHWLARRHSGTWTLHDRMELEAWLNADENHRHAFQQLTRMWGDLDDVKDGIVDLRSAARHYRPVVQVNRSRSKSVTLGLAASLLLSIGTAYWHWIGFEHHYLTAKGETKDITLADGSTLRINTDSELSVRINSSRRNVDLHRGEALFTVAHDAARPFTVNAGAGRIQDIGTRFDVYAQPEQVAVNVLEGSVQISSPAGIKPFATLTAGQATAYDAQGHLIAGYRSDIDTATAWLDGILVFNDLSLPQVTQQLSRYHPISFELADQRLSNIKISGSFQADNLDLMLKTLQASFPIRLSQLDATHIRIQAR